MLWKLRGARFTENFCKFVVVSIKVVQKGIGNIVSCPGNHWEYSLMHASRKRVA